MKIKVFKKGFNYSQDGVGNRLIYHLQGCNMNCPWCSNPESINKNGTLMVYEEWLLDSVCPYGAIRQKRLNRSTCGVCNSKPCVGINKNKGIRFSCEEYELEYLLDEAMRCSSLFYEGGGVTLTGGEPTQQFEAITLLLKDLKKTGIHTAIETNATHPRLEKLFPLIDLLIMDFKHYDNEQHTRITGVGNVIIKENIAKALGKHSNVLIRIPLVKGFNSSSEDIANFAAFFKEMNTRSAAFEFLPYHEFGKIKWLQSGMPYKIENARIEDGELLQYENIFKNNNLRILHT